MVWCDCVGVDGCCYGYGLYTFLITDTHTNTNRTNTPTYLGDVAREDQARHQEHRAAVVARPVSVLALEHLVVLHGARRRLPRRGRGL